MLNLTGLFSRGESIGNWNNWMREDIHNSPSQKSVGGAGLNKVKRVSLVLDLSEPLVC